MATSRTYPARPGYRFLPADQIAPAAPNDPAFELDESDIYDSPAVIRRAAAAAAAVASAPGSRISKKAAGARRADSEGRPSGPSSLPEYRESKRRDILDDDSEGGDNDANGGEGMRVPPHELVARTRMASFSVHEGRGRTLKGRDLSRVRNAIWEKTGFED
ncbi:hypothetical protein CRG98_017046 [Punica granatum]|uniref:Senescence regulator S40 n=1 Tax=Punica granatum TaxID=22663 RepID=A0A2I0K243_PUNGR|nr:hypothetical protein CRG98_017046 [Punica granatum]